MTGSSDVKISPEVFAAHAQFGGDLDLMQKAYEWHDLKTKVRELEELVAEYRDHSQPYWQARAEAAEARIAEARDKALEEAWQVIKDREAEYEASFEANEFKGMSLAAIAALASAAANVRALKEKP